MTQASIICKVCISWGPLESFGLVSFPASPPLLPGLQELDVLYELTSSLRSAGPLAPTSGMSGYKIVELLSSKGKDSVLKISFGPFQAFLVSPVPGFVREHAVIHSDHFKGAAGIFHLAKTFFLPSLFYRLALIFDSEVTKTQFPFLSCAPLEVINSPASVYTCLLTHTIFFKKSLAEPTNRIFAKSFLTALHFNLSSCY